MEYFDDILPISDGECSDNQCPCSPSTRLPIGSGFMYISKETVEMRRDARTVAQLQAKCDLLAQKMGDKAFVFFDKPLVTGVMCCERGARLRGLNLEIAAADAQHWWKTGKIPLRPTPLAKPWWQFWK